MDPDRMTPLGPEELEGFRRRLIAMRDEERELIQSIREETFGRSQTETVGELSSYDQHATDAGAETFEREKDLGLIENAREILGRIDEALDRINEGKYGICASCGRPIGRERLEALPYATLCIRCAGGEAGDDRPVEEELLDPAFARTFNDGEDRTAFDGEDAWQAVARYGAANSPQDVPDSVDYSDAYVGADENRGIVTEIDAVTSGPDPGDPDDGDDPFRLELKKRRLRGDDTSGGGGQREGETVSERP